MWKGSFMSPPIKYLEACCRAGWFDRPKEAESVLREGLAIQDQPMVDLI